MIRQAHPSVFAQLIQAPLQGGLLVFDRLEHGGDHPQLSMHPRADDHPLAASVGSQRAHKGRVAPVPQGDILLQGQDRVLLDRDRLPGESRFFHPQVHGFHQAHICRDVIAGLQENDIARDQVARRGGSTVPVSQDMRLRSRQFLERRQGFLGLALLDDPQDGIQHHDRQDGCRLDVIAQQGGDEGGSDQ